MYYYKGALIQYFQLDNILTSDYLASPFKLEDVLLVRFSFNGKFKKSDRIKLTTTIPSSTRTVSKVYLLANTIS